MHDGVLLDDDGDDGDGDDDDDAAGGGYGDVQWWVSMDNHTYRLIGELPLQEGTPVVSWFMLHPTYYRDIGHKSVS